MKMAGGGGPDFFEKGGVELSHVEKAKCKNANRGGVLFQERKAS